jgi:hypothetical protein
MGGEVSDKAVRAGEMPRGELDTLKNGVKKIGAWADAKAPVIL